MHANPTDTIAAISSPPGTSPRGLIRISGPNTDSVLAHLLTNNNAPPRQLTNARLRHPDIPALLLRFNAPASYTGDDLAEIQLPGNAALLDRLLQQATDLPGTRLAEPGEFTFRAYTAGKLDLTQAEGIGATITAVSDSQLAAAKLLRQGQLGKTAESLVDQLGSLLALVEAGIDFTDQEDVNPIAPPELDAQLAEVQEQLVALRSRSRSWGALEALPRVVLVGPPSAGKSTLFNTLLGRERAVIDPAPGTTRDVIAEPLRLSTPDAQTAEVMLVDLAGLDDALSAEATLIDKDAQATARDAIREADLVLLISDTPDSWLTIDSDTPTIRVTTKSDTRKNSPHRKVGVQATDDANPHLTPGAIDKPANALTPINISAHTGTGLDELRTAITAALAEQAVSLRADMLALQPRHESALRSAADSLEHTRALLKPSMQQDALHDIELLADALRAALDALASLGGRLAPDQVIGRVFATFCVGK